MAELSPLRFRETQQSLNSHNPPGVLPFLHPRQRSKVMYPLDEVLLLCPLAVLAGVETFVDIARFGAKKLALLRRFRRFRDGTPSHDHLGDIFATLDAGQFQHGFVAWLRQHHDWPGLKAIVIIESSREIGNRIEWETCFYITSLVLPTNLPGPIVRSRGKPTEPRGGPPPGTAPAGVRLRSDGSRPGVIHPDRRGIHFVCHHATYAIIDVHQRPLRWPFS